MRAILIALSTLLQTATAHATPEPMAVSVCQLSEKPQHYAGASVRLRGTLHVDLRHNWFLIQPEPGCRKGVPYAIREGSPADATFKQVTDFMLLRRGPGVPIRITMDLPATITGRMLCKTEDPAACRLEIESLRDLVYPPDN